MNYKRFLEIFMDRFKIVLDEKKKEFDVSSSKYMFNILIIK
jgi:hypothetical protein